MRCNQHNGIIFRRFDREFKYNKTKMPLKDSFFTIVSAANYSVRIIYADKTKIYSKKFRTNSNSLKSYLIRQPFTHTRGEIRDCTLCIDGRDTRAFDIPDEDYYPHVCEARAPAGDCSES